MRKDFITFRSITPAQRGQRVLTGAGIACALQRTPKKLAQQGCGYCLRLRAKDVIAAVELLQGNGITYGKIYALTEGGSPEEREV